RATCRRSATCSTCSTSIAMVIAIAMDAMMIETITTTAANHGGGFANITGAGGNAGALFSSPRVSPPVKLGWCWPSVTHRRCAFRSWHCGVMSTPLGEASGRLEPREHLVGVLVLDRAQVGLAELVVRKPVDRLLGVAIREVRAEHHLRHRHHVKQRRKH